MQHIDKIIIAGIAFLASQVIFNLFLPFIWFYMGSRKKKVLPLMARPLRPPPPPSSLMVIGTFFYFLFLSLKIAENGFSFPNFWTKIAIIFGKYCNNRVKIPTDKL